MKTYLFTPLVLLGLLASGQLAKAQTTTLPVDMATAVVVAQQQYTSAFVVHPELYNGPEYLDYAKPYHERTGHQFLLSTESQLGRVAYNKHVFNSIPLNYDIVRDQVVVSPPQSPLTLRLVNEKVQEFTIGTHRFTRLVADSATQSVIRTGYYEVLLDSTVQVLARRSKRMQERISQNYINVEFTQTNKLFMQKAGHYYPVASKSSVLGLFADRSKEMQKYLQDHKLRFNKAQREASIVALATYYCSLPKQ
ncbi:hypothetical protein [Hymenobacter negativus]|uniref:DUF4468 domain-containing protein n=1 Tax=Hymenobacter negativus TaxID=2795026 RepID=A0ABS3QAR3_9BACT|nr:hypothetical protein [Hymenobacter negativus]MBO2008337.1 hypothetical protein [Hymenobacter negativus]